MKIIPLSLALLAIVLCPGASAKTVTASSGSSSAVQSAIDSATDGDTVMIPSGNFSWATGVTVKKAIKLLGNGTTIQNTGNATLVSLTPSSKGSVEVGNLKFTRSGTSAGVYIFGGGAPAKPMLVHDIQFDTAKFGNRSMDWAVNGGVIWGCTFTSLDKGDNSGIAFKNPSSESAWSERGYLGMEDANGDKNTYLEDCTFKDIFLQAMDFDDNSRTVIRHCKFADSAVASHGQETSAVGARQWELYDNEFTFTNPPNNNPGPQDYPLNMNHLLFIRGGTGVCFNNKMPDISSSAWGNKAEIKIVLYNIRRKGQVPCQTQYPAARQMGWGSDAQGRFVLDPMYFWNNKPMGTPSLGDYDPDECGNNLHTTEFVKKDREYYVDVEKPGYQPYTYPHPLRGGAAPEPTPTATPPAPTPSPSAPPPTPAPTASATPIPTPPMLPPGTYRIPEGSTITVP